MLRPRLGPAFWAVLPLALVVLALLGSVALPARETWRITRLLHESTEVLAPARLLQAQLEFGLANELVILQRYVLSGDSGRLGEFRQAAAEDERRLAALERLAARLDVVSAARLVALRRRMGDWREVAGILALSSGSRSQSVAAFEVAQVRHDSALVAASSVSAHLAAIAAARDDRVRSLEHLSLAYNAALVLAALIAMGGVTLLTVRERRLAGTLRLRVDEASRRARQEVVLRKAAESLAGAYTIGEVTQRIASSAVDVVEGSSAIVEGTATRAGDPPDMVVVRAVAGSGPPPVAMTYPLAGSCTEMISGGGEPVLVGDLAAADRWAEPVYRLHGNAGSAIVVPLGASGAPIGALVIVSDEASHFRADDLERAGIFGHLARLSYEKVRLLEEAQDGRRRLEQVIKSRSRLIRGFSHDVKNPIGAADGYAELLSLGVYGELTDEQRASLERLRRSLRGALSLIRDLHEFGRAETGNLVVASEPVDLADLVRAIGEEYDAAARAAGLSLAVEAASDLPILRTDRERVRQIVSNLVSNAIKYTGHGSIQVHASRQLSEPPGDAGGWACITVADTGPGIPLDKQAVIFEEFNRLGFDRHEGAGLGLAISELLARALGGHVSVESESGHGSAFTLWLPLPARTATA